MCNLTTTPPDTLRTPLSLLLLHRRRLPPTITAPLPALLSRQTSHEAHDLVNFHELVEIPLPESPSLLSHLAPLVHIYTHAHAHTRTNAHTRARARTHTHTNGTHVHKNTHARTYPHQRKRGGAKGSSARIPINNIYSSNVGSNDANGLDSRLCSRACYKCAVGLATSVQ